MKSAKANRKTSSKKNKAAAKPEGVKSQGTAKALIEESNLLLTLINNLPDLIYVKDIQGRKMISNTADWQASGGKRMEDVVGKTDFDTYPAELATRFWADDKIVLDSGKPVINREKPGRDSQGNPIWRLTTKVPLRDDNGQIVGLVGIGRDITEYKEYKRAEEALVKEQYEMQNEMQTLMNYLPTYIYFKDRASRFIRISKSQALRFGLSDPAQAIGKSDFDFFTKEHAQPAYEDEQAIIRTGQPLIKEEKETWADHPFAWVSTTKMPMRDNEGNIIGTFGISTDITERKRVEEELVREKKFLEALNLNSPVAIVVLDNDERILSCNPAFEKLYGYKSEEILGALLDTIITTDETSVEAQQFTKQVMQSTVHAISKRRRKDGSLVDVEIFGAPVFVEGNKIAALAIYYDISELMRARREAEDANRAKSEFLANMSHEIRTPMNGVIGMLELALDTQLNDEQRDYLQTSLQSAEALLTLLNDILDFSKIEAGKLELENINFDLRNTVEDVAYTLARRAQDKGLEMACLVHPDLSSDLRGDPGRLRQILVNLVGNAIKFTHQGEIVIRAEPIQETNTYAIVHFSVQDTGIGIPRERLGAVFDRFTQADGSTTRRYGGTGLGLTISKQLVEIMGGKIGVESTSGIGSTFWFDIKFEKQPREKTVTAPLTLGPVNLTQARVLIVDDNQTNRMVLTKNVETLGCRGDAVASGAKALENLHNAQRTGDPYHVVLLDMQMPGMDGEQTARAIKSDPAVKDVKIIILTSMGQRGDAVRLAALGCSAYLLKPVKQQMLFDAVVAVLSREEKQQPGLITRHTLNEQRKLGQRILLAEDNAINQKLAVVLLQKAGYSVDAVETGAQALEKVQSDQYNVVLMDVQMPEMDGFEATQHIREWERERGSHIPIIAMTAHAMQGDRERCLEAGMDDYVSKPLEPKVLFAALDRWVRSTESTITDEMEMPQDYSSPENVFSGNLDEGLFGETSSASRLAEQAAPVSPAVSAADTPPVNLESALYRFGGDRGFMMEMFQKYRAHLRTRVEEIRAAWQEGDANRLGRLAHNLKGVSLNFNVELLANVALKLEELGRREDLTDAPALVAQLDAEAGRLEEYLLTNLL
jgi:two-component system sensor histidine kinase/response regulator